MGNNSLGFIAELARLGYGNGQIRKMYDHALANHLLHSGSYENVVKAARWYREEFEGGE